MKALVPRRLMVLAPVILLACLVWAASANAYVYWGAFGKIGRAANDGSSREPEFIKGVKGIVCGVAVDSGHIYWADRLAETIGRANLDGSNVEPEFIKDAHNACGVAVSSSHVYWTSDDGYVGFAAIDGSGAQVASAGSSPCGIAVDSKYVYWIGGSSSTYKIHRAGLSTPSLTIDTLAATPTGECGLAMGSDRLYWTNGGFGSEAKSGLWSTGKEPLSASAFVAATGPEPWSVAIDGTYAYWSTYKGGAVNRVRLDGTQIPQTNFITGVPNESVGLAVDSLPLPPVPPVEPPPDGGTGGGSESPGGGPESPGGGSGSSGGSGPTAPPAGSPPSAPSTVTPPNPKPAKCKKGTRRKVVKGKAKCVKVKQHKHRRHHHAR